MDERAVALARLELMRIQLLGGFRVWLGEALLPDRALRPKAARLLKLLALAPGHRLHRDEVLERLWPDMPTQAAVNNLHGTLHAVRYALQPQLSGATASTYLHLRGENLSLAPVRGGLWIDAEAFQLASTLARQERTPFQYEAALSLYTGDLLPEDPYDDWIAAYRDTLRALYRALALELALLHEARGDSAAGVRVLNRLAERDPADEVVGASLVRLYAALGQRQQAVRQYEQLRIALVEELGVEPDTTTQRLIKDILAHPIPRASGATPPHPDSVTARPDSGAELRDPRQHNLPASPTSFVGRESELATLVKLLPTTRLLTLVGPGGIGKTRLALQLAERVLTNYGGGVWWVDLADRTPSQDVAYVVASALGVDEEPGRPLLESIGTAIRSKALLLVLDNCEHLLSGCADTVQDLLRVAPGLRVLTTSRQRLGVAEEVAWQVPALAVPDIDALASDVELSHYDAVRLFIARAMARRPDLVFGKQLLGRVVRLCHQLEGIPLAIELACAQLTVLSLENLEVRLADALSLLASRDRAAQRRQRTLRATLDSSVALLSPAEQRLFRRLAVFSGGWTLDDAESVCSGDGIEPAEILGLLAQLVDKSLVLVAEQAGQMRFRLLEVVRQYAHERIQQTGELAATEQRHAAAYLKLAETAAPMLDGAQQATWLERLTVEHDNLRAALRRYLVLGDTRAGLRFASALGSFWLIRGYFNEGEQWLAAALAMPVMESYERASALRAAGQLVVARADYQHAYTYYEESLRLFRQVGACLEAGQVLTDLGNLACNRREYALEASLHEQSLAILTRLDKRGMALALTGLGRIATDRDDLERARRVARAEHRAAPRSG